MNANPQRGEVDIVLDRPRVIRLTTNAIAKAEELIGHSLLTSDPRALGFREVRALLFVGLADPKLTVEKVGDLIDEADKADLLFAIYRAWNLHLGRGLKEADGESTEDPQPTANSGTGTSS